VEIRSGGQARRGGFNGRAHAGRRSGRDPLAEDDEGGGGRGPGGLQRDRVHVGLKIRLVTDVRQRVVEGVEEPVTREGHRAAERRGRGARGGEDRRLRPPARRGGPKGG